MRWLAVTFILAASVIEGGAADLRASKSLPFEFSIVSVGKATQGNGTKLTAQIKNGRNDLSSVSIHCQATSASGTTWDINGKAIGIDANEVRSFALVSYNTNDDTPKLVECMVSGFSIPIVIDP